MTPLERREAQRIRDDQTARDVLDLLRRLAGAQGLNRLCDECGLPYASDEGASRG